VLRDFEDTLHRVKVNRRCGRFECDGASNLRTLVSATFASYAGAYGVYVVRAKSDVIYVGKAGTLCNSGHFKDQGLVGRLCNVRGNLSGEAWFRELIAQYGPVEIEFVVLDETCSPALIEAALLQAYRNEHGRLPAKNGEL